eukprot:12413508-Karenia_brevis.AAC.1
MLLATGYCAILTNEIFKKAGGTGKEISKELKMINQKQVPARPTRVPVAQKSCTDYHTSTQVI